MYTLVHQNKMLDNQTLVKLLSFAETLELWPTLSLSQQIIPPEDRQSLTQVQTFFDDCPMIALPGSFPRKEDRLSSNP